MRDWKVEKGGTYRIQGGTRSALKVTVDGRKVLDVRPFRRCLRRFSAVFDVAPGTHAVTVLSQINPQQERIPELDVKGPDGAVRPLGE
jgi:hypothetical protein